MQAIVLNLSEVENIIAEDTELLAGGIDPGKIYDPPSMHCSNWGSGG